MLNIPGIDEAVKCAVDIEQGNVTGQGMLVSKLTKMSGVMPPPP